MVKRLLYLNGLAVLGVILYHSSAWGYISMFWWTDHYRPVAVPNFAQLGGLTYFVLRFIEGAIIFAIPSFLFVSGFFVSVATGRSQSTVSWKVVLTRIKTLAIPFLIWSILVLLFQLLQGQKYTLGGAVSAVLTGQIYPPYYYVPVLIELYLLSPFLVPLAKKRWELLLVVAGGVQLIVLLLRYPEILGLNIPLLEPFYFLTTGWLFPGYLFWFCFGIVFGFHLPQFKQTIVRFKWVSLAGIFVFFILGMAEWESLLRLSGQPWIGPQETLVDNLYAGAFILSFLAFESFIPPFSSQLANIGGKSYGIYLVHAPVLEFTARVIYHIAPILLATQLILQPILWVVGLGVPLVMMEIVDRSSARKFYGYLFG
jgi:peptidoglycan/LPS O-acetylase OafA/YrhL